MTGGTSSGLPLVSVITPAFNRADHLRETIDSVLDQDYPVLTMVLCYFYCT